jgi:hypothetical protein
LPEEAPELELLDMGTLAGAELVRFLALSLKLAEESESVSVSSPVAYLLDALLLPGRPMMAFALKYPLVKTDLLPPTSASLALSSWLSSS